ncbi:MAG: MarR family winged helix-turn-helix transcriptional regulator [Deinococcales bacterium]
MSTAPDHGSGQDPRPVEAGLGFMLGSAHRALRSAWEEFIADLGLSAPQALVLRFVAESSGVGLRELARRMQTDAMNAKRLADALEDAGLVRSADDPAHRQRRLLCATEEGQAMAARVVARARAWHGHLAERLGSEALTQLRSLLTDLVEALGTERDAPASLDGTRP